MRRLALGLCVVPLLAGGARADSDTDRLRDLLRRTTEQMRALEDQQSTMQASLDEATQQRDQAQKALADRDAQIAALKQAPPVPKVPPAELAALQANIQSLKTQNASLQHLYEREDFRSLLLKSYEPFFGFEKVKLQNMIQDYEDRIRNASFYPTAKAQ